MFFDVHSHLLSGSFNKDREEIVIACKKENISVFENGLDFETNQKVLTFSRTHKNHIFPALGMHPTLKFDERVLSQIRENEKEIVAIGEIGLDYYHEPLNKPSQRRGLGTPPSRPRKDQKQAFHTMLKLAEETKKPVICHSRRARGRVLKMAKGLEMPVVLHAFFGSKKEMQTVKTEGYYITIPAIITYSTQLQEIAKELDLEQIFCETDSPYMWKYGKNTPLNVKKAYEAVARIKEMEIKDLERQIEKNVKKVFGV